MIVVLDTNVWISALQFSGSNGVPLRALHKAARIDTMVTCDEIEVEIAIVLQVRFKWTTEQVVRSLEEALARSIHIRLHGTVKVCRDPNDDKILECAERGKAEVIVSGDKDLLSMGGYKQIRILTPAEYLQAGI